MKEKPSIAERCANPAAYRTEVEQTACTYGIYALSSSQIFPVGHINAFASSPEQLPAGWLPCDGREVDRTQYPHLYEALRESHGGKVPDMREFSAAPPRSNVWEVICQERDKRRVIVMREAHFGIGIRWTRTDYMSYPLHISIALPFWTFDFGLGKFRTEAERGL